MDKIDLETIIGNLEDDLIGPAPDVESLVPS